MVDEALVLTGRSGSLRDQPSALTESRKELVAMIEMRVSIKDSSYPNWKDVHGCRQDGKRRPVVSPNVCRDYVYGVQMIFAGWWLIVGGWGPVKVQMTPNADSASK